MAFNPIGHAIGSVARVFTADRVELIAYLFTTSKKEFWIAAALL